MSANGGEIVVQLRMEDGQYKVAVVQAGELMRQLKGRMDQTSASVQKLESHADSMGRKFRDVVMTLGNLRFVAMDINDIFLRMPMSILKTAGEMERLQALMTGMSKEGDKVKASLEGLSNFNYVVGVSKNAPFEMSAIADSLVKLKSAGIDPANGSMTALINSVARFGGSGETLKRASVAIQQMAGKAVISMEELRQQLGEAVPTAMKAMADGLGMSMSQLAKVVSSGTLEAEPALKRMFARMLVENDGAAAAMMDKWVGVTSRLKTEWELAAKSIADAGFLDAAKRAVSDLTKAMQTEEFRKFSQGAGIGLGKIVTGLTDATEWAVKHRSEIAALAQAYAAYKVATVLLLPAMKALDTARARSVAVLASEIPQLMRNEATRRGLDIANGNAILTRMQQERNATASFIAEKERELVAVQARNAQIIAADQAMHAKLAASRGGVQVPGQGNQFQSRTVAHDYLAGLSTQNSAVIAQERELAKVIAEKQAALMLSEAAIGQQTAALGRMTFATRAQQIASVAMNGAVKAGSVLWAAMGGWAGAAVVAIMSVAYAYDKLSGSANRAAAAQKREKNGSTTEDDLKDTEDDLKVHQKLLKQAEDEYTKYAKKNSKVDHPLANSIREKYVADISNLNAKVMELEVNLKNRKLNLLESAVTDEVAGINLSTRRTVDAEVAKSREEVKAIQEAKEKKLSTLKNGSKEWVSANTEFVAKENESYKKGRLAIAKQLGEMAGDMDKKSGTGDEKTRLAMKKAADETRAMAKQITDELGNFDAPMPTFKEKKGAGGSATPIDHLKDLATQLDIERKRIAGELTGFANDWRGPADKAQGAYDEVMALFAKGKLNITRGGKPFKAHTKEEASEVAEAARALENEKANLKAQTKVAHDAQALTDYIEGLEPRYVDAIKVLSDPLGKSAKGTTELAVEKMFGSGKIKAVEAAAQRAGKTVDEIIKGATNKAAIIDAADDFQKMAEDTKKINDSLVDDSRTASKQRQAAEDERFKNEKQNVIDRLKLHEGMESQILELQKQLDDNTAARSKRLLTNFKSPAEKLVETWRNATRNMEEASVGWANKSMDAMTEMVMTGKADFGSLAASIIADILRINMQRVAGQGFMDMFSFVGKAALPVADIAPAAFANGGIMTEMGSMALKKYAAGGIANSPQMAIFGEGSMNEAYVPLPDGRTIPVTMKGGQQSAAAPQVTVNVINQSGQQVDAQQGQPRFDGKQMVLDIVLSAVSQPGSFRTGMKGALA
jgi:tape measure domain-containing protein